jgi:hypothetical protein
MIRASQRPLMAAAQAAQGLVNAPTQSTAGTAANAAVDTANSACQPAGLAGREQPGAGSTSMARRGPGPAVLARQAPTNAALTSPVGAAQQRGMHRSAPAASPLVRAVLAEVTRMDHAFAQRDFAAVDRAGMALNALREEAAADPSARAAHRDAMAVALALGNDAPDLLRAVFGGVNTIEKLAERFGLPEDWQHMPSELEGRCQLSPEECLALSAYSVRSPHEEAAPQVFRALNAVMRADMPAAQQGLKFLSDPLLAGMEKLPPLPATELRRGLQIGARNDATVLPDLKAQYQPGQQLRMPNINTGSREAAYPGNAVLLMNSAATDTRLRDTSSFSYAEDQREASFLPDTAFKVASCTEQTVPDQWKQADRLVESSGRTWGDRVGEPVLVIRLDEQTLPKKS